MVNPDSDLYRAHPDWILATGGRVPPLQRHQLVLDLTRPEVAHVSAPFSHQTGRFMPLSLRCATALFGHFGIEWDITRADQESLAELTAWIGLYKRRPAAPATRPYGGPDVPGAGVSGVILGEIGLPFPAQRPLTATLLPFETA